MIVYGTKNTTLAEETLADACPSCGNKNCVRMTVAQNYAHVFWIPFFPTGKTAVTECSHCKAVLKKNEFDGGMMQAYERIKSGSKTPIWTFAGLVLLAILIGWGVYSGNQNDAKNAKLITDPKVGDVYEIKKDASAYTLYKVDEIAGDTIYLLMHQYETNKMTGLNELKDKGNEGYGEDWLPVVKNDLKTMLESGEIMDIERK